MSPMRKNGAPAPPVRDFVKPVRAVHSAKCPDVSFAARTSQMSFCSCAGRREGGECVSRRTAKEPFWRETQQRIPGGICLSEVPLRDCATLGGRTTRRERFATHERTQYVTMCPWALTCKSAPPNSSCSKIPGLKGSCSRADPLLECFSLPANDIFLIL